MSVKGLGMAITPLTTQNTSQIKIGLSGIKSLKAREKWEPQKKTSSFSLHTPPPLPLSVSSLCCCSNASLAPFLTSLFPPLFLYFLSPPSSPSKQACPEHWGTSVLRLRKRDENSKELSSDTLLWFRVRVYEAGGALSVFSHLLVLRCRVESGPGRSASGC